MIKVEVWLEGYEELDSQKLIAKTSFHFYGSNLDYKVLQFFQNEILIQQDVQKTLEN